MNSIDSLLNMILTETIEEGASGDESARASNSKPADKLPPIQYTTELIKTIDGKYVWVD